MKLHSREHIWRSVRVVQGCSELLAQSTSSALERHALQRSTGDDALDTGACACDCSHELVDKSVDQAIGIARWSDTDLLVPSTSEPQDPPNNHSSPFPSAHSPLPQAGASHQQTAAMSPRFSAMYRSQHLPQTPSPWARPSLGDPPSTSSHPDDLPLSAHARHSGASANALTPPFARQHRAPVACIRSSSPQSAPRAAKHSPFPLKSPTLPTSAARQRSQSPGAAPSCPQPDSPTSLASASSLSLPPSPERKYFQVGSPAGDATPCSPPYRSRPQALTIPTPPSDSSQVHRATAAHAAAPLHARSGAAVSSPQVPAEPCATDLSMNELSLSSVTGRADRGDAFASQGHGPGSPQKRPASSQPQNDVHTEDDAKARRRSHRRSPSPPPEWFSKPPASRCTPVASTTGSENTSMLNAPAITSSPVFTDGVAKATGGRRASLGSDSVASTSGAPDPTKVGSSTQSGRVGALGRLFVALTPSAREKAKSGSKSRTETFEKMTSPLAESARQLSQMRRG